VVGKFPSRSGWVVPLSNGGYNPSILDVAYLRAFWEKVHQKYSYNQTVVKNHDGTMGRIRQKKSPTKLNTHKKSDAAAMKQRTCGILKLIWAKDMIRPVPAGSLMY